VKFFVHINELILCSALFLLGLLYVFVSMPFLHCKEICDCTCLTLQSVFFVFGYAVVVIITSFLGNFVS
jgi:hypothetical protein